MNDAGTSKYNRLRDLFIKRMTVDSETKDRRRKDYNQAIFNYRSAEEQNAIINCAKENGIPISPVYVSRTFPVFDNMDMDMVLDCFDKAVKDMQKEEKACSMLTGSRK